MADQNDKPHTVAVGPIAPEGAEFVRMHDALEDQVAKGDWRTVLHQHLKAAVGKTHTFQLGDRVDLFALKPGAFAPSAEEMKLVFDEIMAGPETMIVFEDGGITPEFMAGRGGTDLSQVFDHLPPPTHVITANDDGVKVETAREHNERKYPDLMRRLDRLANRPLDDGDDK